MAAEENYDYDVFLSHASANKRWVEVLARNLKNQRKRVFFDENDGKATDFTVKMRNQGSARAYWIALHDKINRAKDNKNPLVLQPPPIHVMLEPGETAELHASVSSLGDYLHPQGGEYDLELVVTSAIGKLRELTLPVLTTAPELAFDGALLERSDRDFLQVALRNAGTQNLGEASYQARLSNPPESLATVTREQLRAGVSVSVPFALENTSIIKNGVDLLQESFLHKLYRSLKGYVSKPTGEGDSTLEVTVHALTYPPHRWIFDNHPITEPPLAWPLYGGGVLMLLAAVIMIYYLRVYRHPLVVDLSRNPSALPDVALEQLPSVQHLLSRTRRLKTVLAEVDIGARRLDDAIRFYQNANPEERCQLLAAP